MSSTEIRGTHSTSGPSVGKVDMKIEVVVIPVSDVDRAREFYEGLGWRLDADFADGDRFRIVQFTPPGSACSIQFGSRVTSVAPGSMKHLYLIVPDVEAARTELVDEGVEVGEVFHERSLGDRFHTDGRISGRAPDGAT